MRIVAGAIAAALLLCVFVGCGGGGGATPPVTTGSLQGYVYLNAAAGLQVSATARAGATPAVGAIITVREQTLSATTDTDGFFQLDGLYTGVRQFFVDYADSTRSTFTFTIQQGMNTAQAVNLEPATLKWMVMVFMAADNNLDNYAVQDLNEMEAAPDSPDVMTIALCDRYGPNNTTLYRIAHDDDRNTISSPGQSLGELNTGDPATLGWFINYCQTDASLPRAEHYLLVLWNHGTGWDPYYDAISGRAILSDDTSRSTMRIVDITAQLQQRYPIDIIATDACLMAMLEVAYEWRSCGDYLVASEELVLGEGFRYDRLLTKLHSAEGLQMTPKDYAKYMAAEAVANGYYQASVTDLGRLHNVAPALDAFSTRLLAIGQQHASTLSAIASEVMRFDGYGDNIDLYDYADLVSQRITDAQLRTSAANLKAAISQAVAAEYHTEAYQRAHGLSIYMPSKTRYMRDAARSYPGLQLSAVTRWKEWLGSQPY